MDLQEMCRGGRARRAAASGRWFVAVACLSATLGLGAVLAPSAVANSSWSWTVANIDGSTRLNDVQCPSVSLCVAVDQNSNVLTSTNPTAGKWSKPVKIDISNVVQYLHSLSCPSSSLCVAFDTAGYVVTSNDPTGGKSAWSSPVHVDSKSAPLDVSCASVSQCVMVDQGGNVETSTDPTGGKSAWSEPVRVAPVGLYDVSCPTAEFCAAGDSNRQLFTSTGGASSWMPPVTLPGGGGANDVSCTRKLLCVVGDGDGGVIASTDPSGGASAWSLARVESSGQIDGVSCSGSLCVAVDNLGHVLTSTNPTGGKSAWTVTTPHNKAQLNAVSCASSSVCVAVDWSGDVLVGIKKTS